MVELLALFAACAIGALLVEVAAALWDWRQK